MARKVILDVDPGVDDAVAMCLAMASPELEVIAVTATGGNVGPRQATLNVQTVIEQVDPSRWPRIGGATPDQILNADGRHIWGDNGFCGAEFNVAELHNRHSSIKVLGDEIRSSPGEITVIATGPLSNMASLLQAEPDLAPLVGHLILLGGSTSGQGNITAAAEFNVYCDPEAAQFIYRLPMTKTLIPLDITQQIVMNFDLLEMLREKKSRTAKFLSKILPGAYRAHRQRLGIEGTYVHDAVAVVAAIHPELFTMERLHGDVETSGLLTLGATVFDRRATSDSTPNMDVATSVEVAGVKDCLLRGLGGAS